MTASILVVAAFLASGAWMVYTLPQQPIAQLSFALVAAAWFLAFGLGYIRQSKLPKPVVYGLLAFVVAALLATFLNPSVIQALVYDVYGDMPVVLWLCYPALFLFAAMLSISKDLIRGLRIIFWLGLGLVAVGAIWRWTSGFVTVFGSPAYAAPALAPLVVLGLGLAAVSKKSSRFYYMGAAVLAILLGYASGGLLAVAALAFSLVAVLAIRPELLKIPQKMKRGVQIAGSVLLTVLLLGTLLVQIPVLREYILPTDKAANMEQTVATRVLLWDGAQEMFKEKPLFGYGASGYRSNAIKYYDERIFPFVASLGSDPVAYSAPSPHSLFWDLLLRTGIIGFLAAMVLLGIWGYWVRRSISKDSEETGQNIGTLRAAFAIGFLTYLFSLLFTPVHFASGLFGVVLGGLALAPMCLKKDGSRTAFAEEAPFGKAARVTCIVVAILLASFGVWKAVGLTASSVTDGTIEENAVRAENAARIIPGEPLNERHRLEVALALSQTDKELKVAQSKIDRAPAYIVDYGPNLAQFAKISLGDAEVTGRKDYEWEQKMLDRASEGYPMYPLLKQELEHLLALKVDQQNP